MCKGNPRSVKTRLRHITGIPHCRQKNRAPSSEENLTLTVSAVKGVLGKLSPHQKTHHPTIMGGGAQELKIPDWRMYRVEGCAKLEDVQRKLAAKGLRDPWLR